MKTDRITTTFRPGHRIHISMAKVGTSALEDALKTHRLEKRDIPKVKAHLEMRKKNPNKVWGFLWA